MGSLLILSLFNGLHLFPSSGSCYTHLPLVCVCNVWTHICFSLESALEIHCWVVWLPGCFSVAMTKYHTQVISREKDLVLFMAGGHGPSRQGEHGGKGVRPRGTLPPQSGSRDWWVLLDLPSFLKLHSPVWPRTHDPSTPTSAASAYQSIPPQWFFCLFAWTPVPGMVMPTFRESIPTPVKPLWKCPYRPTRRFIS